MPLSTYLEQAKGMLVERLSCTPDEAFESLVAQSHRTNCKVRDIAADQVRTREARAAATLDESAT